MCWLDHRGDIEPPEANAPNMSGDFELLDFKIDSSNKNKKFPEKPQTQQVTWPEASSPDLHGLSLK